uniref:Uncharacterized protein n=2 Tax=unclassified bacterial viruses TaxID=12333 RepID=A0AAU6VYA3_9VIRU
MNTTINALIETLTQEEKAFCVANYYGARAIFSARGKVKAAAMTAKGAIMVKESAQYYVMDWEQAKAIHEALTAHTEAVTVVSVSDKYSDNNGAWEVMTLADANGVQWEVGNMYDSSACFRTMTNEQRLAYANKA